MIAPALVPATCFQLVQPWSWNSSSAPTRPMPLTPPPWKTPSASLSCIVRQLPSLKTGMGSPQLQGTPTALRIQDPSYGEGGRPPGGAERPPAFAARRRRLALAVVRPVVCPEGTRPAAAAVVARTIVRAAATPVVAGTVFCGAATAVVGTTRTTDLRRAVV